MQADAASEAREVEVVRAEGTGKRFDYIGSPGLINAQPQAFLVDRLYPGALIPPHFHDIDQYQVVVEGACAMGKKAADPVTFQYADAYTPYGPIQGERMGFAFFTLRPIASGGFFAMPGNKHNMPCRAGRNIAGHFDREGPRPAPGEIARQPLMAPQDDGVDALGLRLGPRARAEGPPSDAGGQYYLVCGGTLERDGESFETELGERDLISVPPGVYRGLVNEGEEEALMCVMLGASRPRIPTYPPDHPLARIKR